MLNKDVVIALNREMLTCRYKYRRELIAFIMWMGIETPILHTSIIQLQTLLVFSVTTCCLT
jgi:hypothetical protein